MSSNHLPDPRQGAHMHPRGPDACLERQFNPRCAPSSGACWRRVATPYWPRVTRRAPWSFPASTRGDPPAADCRGTTEDGRAGAGKPRPFRPSRPQGGLHVWLYRRRDHASWGAGAGHCVHQETGHGGYPACQAAGVPRGECRLGPSPPLETPIRKCPGVHRNTGAGRCLSTSASERLCDRAQRPVAP